LPPPDFLETFRTFRSPNLAVSMHFFYLTNIIKIDKNCKNTKIANILETVGKIAKSSNFQP